MAPESLQAIAKRMKEIRRLLGPWPGKLLPRPQLAKRLGVDASAIKKWETGEVRISSENALKLAKLVGCDVEWILAGTGRGPIAPGAATAKRPAAVREAAQGFTAKQPSADGGPPIGLAPDDIATAAAKVLEPLIERLATRSPITAAMWLQAAAIEANRQGVTEVYDLMELAQELLREAHAETDRSRSKTVHPPE